MTNLEVERRDKISECQSYYEAIHRHCGLVLDESFQNDPSGGISRCHSHLVDLKLWLEALASRPETEVLTAAAREYHYSILALLQGLYRHSFMSLRLYLEMALATVHFSAHEFDLRLWQRGERDIRWAPLIDADLGVLSKPFVRAFCENLTDEAETYRSIATKVYRECSEFVHGNSHTHGQVPPVIEFNKQSIDTWIARSDSIRIVVSFALCARYIRFLDDAALAKLEPAILDSIGYLAEIRALFDETTEARK